MFKGYKYSVISKTYMTCFFFRFFDASTGNVRMSEGTFCRVEVHIIKNLNKTTTLEPTAKYLKHLLTINRSTLIAHLDLMSTLYRRGILYTNGTVVVVFDFWP